MKTLLKPTFPAGTEQRIADETDGNRECRDGAENIGQCYTARMKKETRHATLYKSIWARNFDEVQGQEHVVGVLEKEIQNKKPAHAYLFAGGRGQGRRA